MSDNNIPSPTVAEWKSKGFNFAPTTDAVDCTEVTLGGEPFYYFLRRRVTSAQQLMANLRQELNRVTDNRLIVAGEFADGDEFPYFLVPAAAWSVLVQTCREYDEAVERANERVSSFARTLTLPAAYWD